MKMKEYELYVPLISQNKKTRPGKELKHLEQRLISRFGGITRFPQKNKGVWKIGRATFIDKIIIIRVLVEDEKDAQVFWRKLKVELQHAWNQRHILIIVRNVNLI
jgi:hypothetical protein